MEPDDTLDGALHGLARHARQTGRLAPVTEVRRRGDIRRRRRQVATAALGVALVGALGAGVTAVRLADAPHGTLPAGPDGRTPGPPPGTPSVTPTPGTSRAPATGGPTGGSGSPPPSTTGSSGSPSSGAPRTDPLGLGQRQFVLIRTSAAESVVSLLDDGGLGEVDGEEGRRLFVFVPQKSGHYLVRTAEPDADGDRACWQVQSAGSAPLTVAAAPCLPTEPRQLFSIVVSGSEGGKRTYAISNSSAYLQYSSQRGLILEELGDATLDTVFRFVDNGAAPRS
ncbi:hypothetical protein [Micromonospora rifamycinica]|uniref:RICIN domain-containing protein n=1 Tax=Micromonospora rifamycinica TaxID=291594 RepID=A0A109III4_9ACTN|nr:hypothetical protein [Micromonospora rifamycinica]KWV31184.1 hypothetical protein AWV63_18970 [Micromonospora rifamycinica]SCG38183.1 hypothetical protein GA0070623_0407 [Micromonospora rifamycinica]